MLAKKLLLIFFLLETNFRSLKPTLFVSKTSKRLFHTYLSVPCILEKKYACFYPGSASEDLLLEKMLEQMKCWFYCRNYYQDIEFISYCEKAILRMQQLNAAFLINHAAAKLIISKLSTVSMRDKLTDKLNDLRYKAGDTNSVNNYIIALQEVLAMARVDV